MTIFAQVGWSLVIIAVIGIAAHFIGEALPRAAFNWQQAPFAPYKWEQGGGIYRKLRVDKWKNRLPDKSRVLASCFPKKMDATPDAGRTLRLLAETCVAEVVHWALLVVSPIVGLIIRTPLSWGIAAIYGLSNLPFIIIQRYNRLRLAALALRLQAREQRMAVREAGEVA